MTSFVKPGEKINKIISKLSDPNQHTTDSFIQDIKLQAKFQPNWNLYYLYGKDNEYKHMISYKKPIPGSYRRILKRKKHCKGVLFWDSTKRDDRTENIVKQNFKLIAHTGPPEPPKYNNKCYLCKTDKVLIKMAQKLGRKGRYLEDVSKNLEHPEAQLGLMVTNSKEGVDLMVHQLCVDYAPAMVQNYDPEDGVVKIDGYSVDQIKSLKGTSCKYCNKSKALTSCAAPKCKSKIFFLNLCFYGFVF